MQWTGERVIPEMMKADNKNVQEQLDKILKAHLQRYNWAMNLVKGKTVLDAACGSGYGVEMLSQVATVSGVDVSEEAIEYARSKYPYPFAVCDLEKDFPSGEYDVITSFETIEHLNDPSNFLETASKRCKEFLFSIPLNCPSVFHKQVYNLEQAKELISRYFKEIEWFEQTDEIKPLDKGGQFILGIAK